MTKHIAELPDFLGDEWDPFVEQIAQEIMSVQADRTADRFQINLTSLTLTQPIILIYKAETEGAQTVIWVDINDRKKIPLPSLAAMTRAGWVEGPQQNGRVSFMKKHKDTDVPTRIPRDLVPTLRMLKTVPLPKKA